MPKSKRSAAYKKWVYRNNVIEADRMLQLKYNDKALCTVWRIREVSEACKIEPVKNNT